MLPMGFYQHLLCTNVHARPREFQRAGTKRSILSTQQNTLGHDKLEMHQEGATDLIM